MVDSRRAAGMVRPVGIGVSDILDPADVHYSLARQSCGLQSILHHPSGTFCQLRCLCLLLFAKHSESDHVAPHRDSAAGVTQIHGRNRSAVASDGLRPATEFPGESTKNLSNSYCLEWLAFHSISFTGPNVRPLSLLARQRYRLRLPSQPFLFRRLEPSYRCLFETSSLEALSFRP